MSRATGSCPARRLHLLDDTIGEQATYHVDDRR